jgi:molecular chaperone Hsp33
MILDKQELVYRCTCSRERVEKAFITLGPEEISNLTRDQERTEVTCEFCGEQYVLERKELKQLIRGTP